MGFILLNFYNHTFMSYRSYEDTIYAIDELVGEIGEDDLLIVSAWDPDVVFDVEGFRSEFRSLTER